VGRRGGTIYGWDGETASAENSRNIFKAFGNGIKQHEV